MNMSELCSWLDPHGFMISPYREGLRGQTQRSDRRKKLACMLTITGLVCLLAFSSLNSPPRGGTEALPSLSKYSSESKSDAEKFPTVGNSPEVTVANEPQQADSPNRNDKEVFAGVDLCSVQLPLAQPY